jgi:hypothetical protein
MTGTDLFRSLQSGGFAALSLNPGALDELVVVPCHRDEERAFLRLAACGAACFDVLAGPQSVRSFHAMVAAEETSFFLLSAWNPTTGALGQVRNDVGSIVLTWLDKVVCYPLAEFERGQLVPAARLIGGAEVVRLAEEGGVAVVAAIAEDRSFSGVVLGKGDWERIEARAAATKQ